MKNRQTAPSILAKKGSGEGVVVLTAYDAAFGSLADEAGVDIILVGDSVANTCLGFSSTVSATLEMMVHHTAAVCRAVQNALVVADMPFGSYGSSVAQAVDSAVELMRAGAGAVKLEGVYLEEIRAIIKAGIPVMGHCGMTPQSVHNFGGHKVQGKGDAGKKVLADATELSKAGCFATVLELIPSELGQEITQKVSNITIGIGAGPHTDGQVQVLHDMLGLSPMKFRHAKAYCDGRSITLQAMQDYARAVRERSFEV